LKTKRLFISPAQCGTLPEFPQSEANRLFPLFHVGALEKKRNPGMKHKRIREAIRQAILTRDIGELSDEQLGLDVIERIARDSEALEILAEAAFLADNQPELLPIVASALAPGSFDFVKLDPLKGIAKKRIFRSMGRGAFSQWLRKDIGERVRKLICDSLYGMIDTPEEREKIIDKYDDTITDAIISAHPALTLARPLIKAVVRHFLAQGMARAAGNLEQYCTVAQ